MTITRVMMFGKLNSGFDFKMLRGRERLTGNIEQSSIRTKSLGEKYYLEEGWLNGEGKFLRLIGKVFQRQDDKEAFAKIKHQITEPT